MKATEKEATKDTASFGAAMKAVFWSFFGIRRNRDYDTDAKRLNPLHVVVAAVMGALIFIATLILIVKSVVAK